jgi:hypothetical protein
MHSAITPHPRVLLALLEALAALSLKGRGPSRHSIARIERFFANELVPGARRDQVFLR